MSSIPEYPHNHPVQPHTRQTAKQNAPEEESAPAKPPAQTDTYTKGDSESFILKHLTTYIVLGTMNKENMDWKSGV